MIKHGSSIVNDIVDFKLNIAVHFFLIFFYYRMLSLRLICKYASVVAVRNVLHVW